jgi:hypothetical protein
MRGGCALNLHLSGRGRTNACAMTPVEKRPLHTCPKLGKRKVMNGADDVDLK